MFQYIVRRLLLMVITLLGVTVITFGVINMAPGSPIEQRLQALRFGGGGRGSSLGQATVPEQEIEALKKQYGFDKPLPVRYWIWLKNISHLNFGQSFTYEEPVTKVILSKMPVSLQFGIASVILTYLICIPLGIIMAVKEGSAFDLTSSLFLFTTYALPSLIVGILLITFLAGGNFLHLFPIGRLYSDNYSDLSTWGKITDRIWHFVLPLTCYTIGNLATLTFLMKDSLLGVVKLDYIRTARAKGVGSRALYFKHALRNALIPIVTGIGDLLGIFLSGSIIIEKLFQLDGIGLLSLTSVLQRDYNVIMGLIFLSALALLLGRLVSDLAYVLVDPRIDFS